MAEASQTIELNDSRPDAHDTRPSRQAAAMARGLLARGATYTVRSRAEEENGLP